MDLPLLLFSSLLSSFFSRFSLFSSSFHFRPRTGRLYSRVVTSPPFLLSPPLLLLLLVFPPGFLSLPFHVTRSLHTPAADRH